MISLIWTLQSHLAIFCTLLGPRFCLQIGNYWFFQTLPQSNIFYEGVYFVAQYRGINSLQYTDIIMVFLTDGHWKICQLQAFTWFTNKYQSDLHSFWRALLVATERDDSTEWEGRAPSPLFCCLEAWRASFPDLSQKVTTPAGGWVGQPRSLLPWSDTPPTHALHPMLCSL